MILDKMSYLINKYPGVSLIMVIALVLFGSGLINYAFNVGSL